MWALLTALCCSAAVAAAKLVADSPPAAAVNELACADEWQQCGGAEWAGASCCVTGLNCVARDKWYSQCVRVEPRQPRGMPGPNGTCSSAWEQCGGLHWAGATCCSSGFNCTDQNQWYSQCIPVPALSSPTPAPAPRVAKPGPDGKCSAVWEQCDGAAWSGATCCAPGSECTTHSEWYSQCTPTPLVSNGTCAGEWEQCGGKDWTGASCCVLGLECEVKDEYYWQCLRTQPPHSLAHIGERTQLKKRHTRFLRKTLASTAPILLQSAHALAQGGSRPGTVQKGQAGKEAGGRKGRAQGRTDVPVHGVEL